MFNARRSTLRTLLATWLMVALVGAAFALRVRNLGVSDLTFDECASAFNAGKSYLEMFRYLLGAFHELPPAYYVLLRAWTWLAGRGEFALRYPSVMFGVLGVALIYRIGRRGLGSGVGVLSALILALQPFHFYYSQDARPYSLMALEALLMVYFFDRLCRDRRLRWWLAFGLTGAFAVLTHYWMAFVVAALCVYLLLHLRAHWRLALPWFGGLIAVGVVMLGWLVTSRAGRLAWRTLQGFSWRGFVKRLAPAQRMLADVVFGSIKPLSTEWLAFVAVVVALGLAAAIFGRRWKTLQPGGAWLLPAWLIVPTLLLILVPERLEARYNAAILPAYCLLLALAVAWLWQSRYARVLAPVVLGLLLYAQVTTLVPTMNVIKSDYGHVVAYLRRHARPGDSLILNGDWQWVQQLYYPAPEQMPKYTLPPSTPPGLDPAQAQPVLEQALATSKRIWVLPAAVEQADPQRFVAGWLNEHAYFASDYKELSLYVVGDPSVASAPVNQSVMWDDVVQLASVRWTQNQAAPGEPLLLDLNWRALRSPRDLIVSLRLVDRDGGEWYSTQFAPGEFYAPSSAWQPGEQHTTRIGIPIPLGAPPGAYDMRVNIVGLRSDSEGDSVTLTGAQVLPCSPTNPCAPLLEGEDLTPVNARLDEGLTLVGYQLGGKEFVQGRFAAITLYWRAEHALTADVTEYLAMVDRAGRVVEQIESPPVAGWYPSSQWTPGQVLADPQAILVPPRLAPGEYSFRLSLFTSDGRAVGQDVQVGRFVVRARERQFRVWPIPNSLTVEFGDRVRLLGYDIAQASPGNIKLVLYWQAMREMEENYTVFRHIVGPDGILAGQKDGWPRDGDYPTSFWMRGEIVTDEVVVPFSTEAGPGAYRIEFGLYDAATGQRLAATRSGIRLENDAFVISVNVER
jgi:mannosyltransferase